MANSSATS